MDVIEATLLPDPTQRRGGAGLNVQIQESDNHLSMKAEGSYTFENLDKLFDKAREECERRARKVVILDTTGIVGTVPNVDMHDLAAHFGKVWNRTVRIVIVSPAGGVNKFFECVLWTRGIHVAVVASQCAAAEWVDGSA
jgi:hypothetical protein